MGSHATIRIRFSAIMASLPAFEKPRYPSKAPTKIPMKHRMRRPSLSKTVDWALFLCGVTWDNTLDKRVEVLGPAGMIFYKEKGDERKHHAACKKCKIDGSWVSMSYHQGDVHVQVSNGNKDGHIHSFENVDPKSHVCFILQLHEGTRAQILSGKQGKAASRRGSQRRRSSKKGKK